MPVRAVSDPAGKKKISACTQVVQADFLRIYLRPMNVGAHCVRPRTAIGRPYLERVASSSSGMESGRQARISTMAPK